MYVVGREEYRVSLINILILAYLAGFFLDEAQRCIVFENPVELEIPYSP